MPKFESYCAKADPQVAMAVAGEPSPFTIEVRFLGGLTDEQKAAFKSAADRWSRIIIGDLPGVLVDGEVIDDVLILAQGTDIDGPGKILGQAGPTHLRPAAAGDAAYLPAKGIMSFDKADLTKMQQNGTLGDVIAHEMGHVLGFGTVWSKKELLKGAGSKNPTFTGKAAKKQYRALRGPGSRSTGVPVENTGGPGTRDSHWRETVFRRELMSGYIAEPGNCISGITVGSLQDLGYVVDMDAAEAFGLPDLLQVAEEGKLVTPGAAIDGGVMLTNIPIVLPEESLQDGSS